MWALPVSRTVFVTSLLFRAGFQYSAACNNVVLFIVFTVYSFCPVSFIILLHIVFQVLHSCVKDSHCFASFFLKKFL